MNVEDAAVLEFLYRSMVVRIASLSRSGRPSVNPLYFIYHSGKIWLGTPEWTLAVRNIKADPRVSLLFEMEQDLDDRRVLKISGRARLLSDPQAMRVYNLRAVRKYILTPGGLHNWLTHLRQLWLRRYYTAQSAQKGPACIIEVKPEEFELLTW